ncbi:hypothetical protein QE327_gp059 [Pseudomonas phage Henu5]|uniref:Uncharacterized protein n=1 Tax=Pseudomonas phage Henu5 TaxID=2499902 RepID=A0A410T8C5_9CAUD|nr:hypothetical protein QE327_gp059 [Pseudomonas phage Henu5]QAU05092.1 hypothetical protein Henu5_gp62 [Pseudomonas phage Henu5]
MHLLIDTVGHHRKSPVAVYDPSLPVEECSTNSLNRVSDLSIQFLQTFNLLSVYILYRPGGWIIALLYLKLLSPRLQHFRLIVTFFLSEPCEQLLKHIQSSSPVIATLVSLHTFRGSLTRNSIVINGTAIGQNIPANTARASLLRLSVLSPLHPRSGRRDSHTNIPITE